jgi:DMSO/TMAO reductase YedYZ heme-binding membrane subunit
VTALLAAGGNARALWYLTRGTGAVALLLLSGGIVLGVLSSTRWRSNAVPRFLVSGLHRNVTLLAIAFVGIHVVTTIADGFAPIGLRDAVVPFLSPYRPVWLGLGAVAFDLLLALVVTSLLRTRIGLRGWRAVHWLAYASWPVALVHALGTGSDVRTGWLPVLAAASTAVVVAAVLWRVARAADGSPILRVGAGAAALVVPLAVLVWAGAGPLRKGWAARAGTPRSLLAPARVAAPPVRAVATSSPAPPRTAVQLPRGPFDASFRGRLRETAAGQGLVTVAIDGRANGGFTGRVHVALRGVPLDGGGVQMIDSSVGLLPAGAGAWSPGRVVGLEGQLILADVRAGGGRSLRIRLALRIDAASGVVRGSIHGSRAVYGQDAPPA